MAKLTQRDRDDITSIMDVLKEDGSSNQEIADQLDMDVKRVAKLIGKVRLAKKAAIDAGQDVEPLPDRRGATEDVEGKEFLASL